MCFAFVLISKEPVSHRPTQDTARAYSLVWDCRGLRGGAKGALWTKLAFDFRPTNAVHRDFEADGEYYPSFPFESKRDVTQLPHEIENYSASMVETPRVISSNTSSRTFTVSSAVKIVTLFSTAVRRIS